MEASSYSPDLVVKPTTSWTSGFNATHLMLDGYHASTQGFQIYKIWDQHGGNQKHKQQQGFDLTLSFRPKKQVPPKDKAHKMGKTCNTAKLGVTCLLLTSAHRLRALLYCILMGFSFFTARCTETGVNPQKSSSSTSMIPFLCKCSSLSLSLSWSEKIA